MGATVASKPAIAIPEVRNRLRGPAEVNKDSEYVATKYDRPQVESIEREVEQLALRHYLSGHGDFLAPDANSL